MRDTNENVHTTCGEPISITAHACRSRLKVVNLNESRHALHKIHLPKTNIESKFNSMYHKHTFGDPKHTHLVYNVGSYDVLRQTRVIHTLSSLHPMLVRYETCDWREMISGSKPCRHLICILICMELIRMPRSLSN